MTDRVWEDYVEAVTHLARTPELLAERRRQATAEEEAMAGQAQAALDAALTRCDQWNTQAKRALATAEARLVAARILVPHPSGAPTVSYDSPDPLVSDLLGLVRKLDGDVAALQSARRQVRLEAAEWAAHQARMAARRRRLVRIGAVVAGVLVVLVAGLVVVAG